MGNNINFLAFPHGRWPVCLGAGIFGRDFALTGIFGYRRQGERNDVASYKFVWDCVYGTSSSSTTPHHCYYTLAIGSYILGWLSLTEPIYLSSRPSLYLIVPWRFRFARTSAWPRLGGTVDAGSCYAASLSRGSDTLGAIFGPKYNRSGVLIARNIVVPPWDSPASWASPVGLGNIIGTIILLLLLSGLNLYKNLM